MLGKVAMGIMVAKTVGKAMGGSGGIGDMLGGLIGGNKSNDSGTKQGNKLPDLMGSLGDKNSSGLGDLLSSALSGGKVDPTPTQEQQAEIILKAMINAAKADGQIDADEQKKITEHIGEVTPEEIEFVRNEMSAPLDVEGVIKSVPKGMEQQVYLMSLLTINLDHEKEAHYLDKLAKGLNISQQVANEIHQKVGAPQLYS
jgi:uncharacterized membrane protein YebE (DUF533 family)